MLFKDRFDAGRRLASRLMLLDNHSFDLVLGLPRGGVPVAFEVAKAISANLDLFLVRKLGVPGDPELAMGAIASGGVRVLNEEVIRAWEVTPVEVEAVEIRELSELKRQEGKYRGGVAPLYVQGKSCLLVDDGIATGATIRAACSALRKRQPSRIVVAVPVGASSACSSLRQVADEVICAFTPKPFLSVGEWYFEFRQVSDGEVAGLIKEFNKEPRNMGPNTAG